MKRLGLCTLFLLAFAVTAYAVLAYGFLPLGSVVHPDMKVSFIAHRAGLFVDARLAGHADVDERVVNAPDRAEQADEWCRRRHGGEVGLAEFELAAVFINRAFERPGQQIVR